jgi:hypothetical protein
MNTPHEQLRSELENYEPSQGPGELARILADIAGSEPPVLSEEGEEPVGTLMLLLVHFEVQLFPNDVTSLPGLMGFLGYSRREVLTYLWKKES